MFDYKSFVKLASNIILKILNFIKYIDYKDRYDVKNHTKYTVTDVYLEAINDNYYYDIIPKPVLHKTWYKLYREKNSLEFITQEEVNIKNYRF